MTFSFHPEAEEEFSAAIEYYEEREVGLGYDFSIEVFTAIHNITTHPALGRLSKTIFAVVL